MKLACKTILQWPKLAWVASIESGCQEMQVLCGPMVEKAEDWVVEAVWAGDFEKGGFDQTDLVFGTGVRCRDNGVAFISSGSTLDRLVYRVHAQGCQVSNSLGALLACAKCELRDDYDYSKDLKSICRGLACYARSIPASDGNIGLAYYNNLIWDGRSLREVAKPDACLALSDFSDYRQFLTRTAQRIADNIRARERKHAMQPLVSISSGYDSVAAAVIVSQAGCRHAVTIGQSTSLWRGSDSGALPAHILGLQCRTYPRTSRFFPHEEAIWAVGGRPGVLNWTLFDYPEPLCCFFTGCHGDKVWTRDAAELSDPFVIPSIAELGIGEFRLIKGIVHCPVPHWGIRHLKEIRAITFREEMKPWTLGKKGYDRPIARRIVEEAGVPRGAFAIRKKNTAHEAAFLWPYSPEARLRFAAFLKKRGLYAPARRMLSLVRRLDHVENLLHLNLLGKIGMRKRLRPWDHMQGTSLIFYWANEQLKQRYLDGLREIASPAAAPTSASSEATEATRP